VLLNYTVNDFTELRGQIYEGSMPEVLRLPGPYFAPVFTLRSQSVQQQWSAVDNFMISSLIPEDEVSVRYWKTTNAPGYLSTM
jgi:hypothetical protein